MINDDRPHDTGLITKSIKFNFQSKTIESKISLFLSIEPYCLRNKTCGKMKENFEIQNF